MKKLFTVEDWGVLWVESEGSVYSVSDWKGEKRTFYDREGKVLENYSRTDVDYEDSAIIEDPDFVEEIGEGFYLYTTHEVRYDMDGKYGLFGIKRRDGTKLTEEIYYQVAYFCSGLCAVSIEPDRWGCIDTDGNQVIPYKFSEELLFNPYGVAVGDGTLIDREGNEIPDTELNCIDDCGSESRYFVFSLLSDEQSASIDKCGTAPDIRVDIYDTKNRRYVLKGIPECRLDVYAFDGEPEVILAAKDLIERYDHVRLDEKRTVLCKKDGYVTVYEYES